MVVFNLPHNQLFPLSSQKQDIALTLSYLSGFFGFYIYIYIYIFLHTYICIFYIYMRKQFFNKEN